MRRRIHRTISRTQWNSLVETLEILQDEELMAAIRQGMKEESEGKLIPWEEVKRQLDL